MKVLIILIVLFCCTCYYGVILYNKLQFSRNLTQEAVAYSNPSGDTKTTLLVLGDSTAVGVGASTSTDTVAALFADTINASHVENYAVSGAVISDLDEQRGRTLLASYDYILIQIGGNDIIRLHNVTKAQNELDKILSSLPETKKLYVMSAGNVGGTTFFPWFINPLYTKITLAYHAMFGEIVPKHSGQYINLYVPPESDSFLKEPQVYLSADGIHPSSAGYRIWYEKLQSKL